MSARDSTATVHGGRWDADLPVNPFLALRARFGMLLGEDDFLTLMGNGRGKLMLHGAWLHGSGVVHGYRVGVDADTKARTYILRVSSGLAVDGLGRELYLGGDWCQDLGRDAFDPSKRFGELDRVVANAVDFAVTLLAHKSYGLRPSVRRARLRRRHRGVQLAAPVASDSWGNGATGS